MVELDGPRITLSTKQKLSDRSDTVTVALKGNGRKLLCEGGTDPCGSLGVQEGSEITQDGSQGKSMSDNPPDGSTYFERIWS